MKAGSTARKGGQAGVKVDEDKSKRVDMNTGESTDKRNEKGVTKWGTRRRAATEKALGRSRANWCALNTGTISSKGKTARKCV